MITKTGFIFKMFSTRHVLTKRFTVIPVIVLPLSVELMRLLFTWPLFYDLINFLFILLRDSSFLMSIKRGGGGGVFFLGGDVGTPKNFSFKVERTGRIHSNNYLKYCENIALERKLLKRIVYTLTNLCFPRQRTFFYFATNLHFKKKRLKNTLL